MPNCKRVINFDECYTTRMGDAPSEIKKKPVCGQYLLAKPNINVPQLLSNFGFAIARKKSLFQKQDRYESGTILPNGDDLLLAFALLDESGKGVFQTLKDYTDSLSKLWEELDKYYAMHDVCIPLLGSGISRIGEGKPYSKQELLDMIIWSYKMSPYKIKKPYALRIVCMKDDISLDKITG